MRLWKVLVLLNLALCVGIGLGYLRWAREVRSLQDEIDRLRAQAARPSAQSWTVRGIVRSLIPKLGAVFLTHEALPGLMDAMTMVRREGEKLILVSIEKVRTP
jgi:hypothetical protein